MAGSIKSARYYRRRNRGQGPEWMNCSEYQLESKVERLIDQCASRFSHLGEGSLG